MEMNEAPNSLKSNFFSNRKQSCWMTVMLIYGLGCMGFSIYIGRDRGQAFILRVSLNIFEIIAIILCIILVRIFYKDLKKLDHFEHVHMSINKLLNITKFSGATQVILILGLLVPIFSMAQPAFNLLRTFNSLKICKVDAGSFIALFFNEGIFTALILCIVAFLFYCLDLRINRHSRSCLREITLRMKELRPGLTSPMYQKEMDSLKKEAFLANDIIHRTNHSMYFANLPVAFGLLMIVFLSAAFVDPNTQEWTLSESGKAFIIGATVMHVSIGNLIIGVIMRTNP